MSLIKTILVDDDYLVLKDLRSMIDWKARLFDRGDCFHWQSGSPSCL